MFCNSLASSQPTVFSMQNSDKLLTLFVSTLLFSTVFTLPLSRISTHRSLPFFTYSVPFSKRFFIFSLQCSHKTQSVSLLITIPVVCKTFSRIAESISFFRCRNNNTPTLPNTVVVINRGAVVELEYERFIQLPTPS